MVDAVVKKASLWRESWKAVKASVPVMWPWVVGFSIFDMVTSFIFPHITPQTPHFLLIEAFLVFSVCLMALGMDYIIIVKYLRFAMKNNRPDYSASGFFYWIPQIFFAGLFCFLWLLIPIIGIFLFIRAAIYYQLVSPLAVLRRGDELKTSKRLVKGNWWRVFGNLLLLMLPLIVSTLLIQGWGFFSKANLDLLVSTLSYRMISYSYRMISYVYTVVCLLENFILTVFSCTCYRILSQEAQAALPPAGIQFRFDPEPI